MRKTLLVLFSFALATHLALADTKGDRTALLAGVKQIAVAGSPGPVCPFGESAFVLIADEGKSPNVVVAASTLGRGRLVAFGHEGYFHTEALQTADTAKLLVNLARWASEPSPRKGKRTIGLRGCKDAEAFLHDSAFTCQIIDGQELTASLINVDAIILPAAEISAHDLPALTAFVNRGGGVIAGVPGWGYLQTHPAAASLATDLPANKLFSLAGLVWSDGSVEAGPSHRFSVTPTVSNLLNARAALDAIIGETKGKPTLSAPDTAIATATLTRAAQSIPPEDKLLLPDLQRVAKQHVNEAIVSEKSDLMKSNALGRVALTFELVRERSVPPEQVSANPLAKIFPGEIPSGAAHVQRQVEIDLSVPEWHSTGLYAAPGEVVTVTVPAIRSKLRVRIGCHSDNLSSQPTWKRAPEIDRTWPLKPGENRIASGFGGLIYIVVPRGESGVAKVSIANAVAAPLFVLDKTTIDEWKALRTAPAPWAELGSGKIILTVPSQFVRTLDDPISLMRWWDKVADGAADLYQIPRERPRPERYVPDIQISAGYMHSGYPIMTHLDAAPRMVDLPTLSTNGEWGLFHELGHNHQRPEWTFAGTGEVTNNLLPLYLLETLCNHAAVHQAFTPAAREKAESKYIAAGADFTAWQKDPFLALVMYQQIRDAFGWETLQKVFAEYRELKPDQRPKTDLEKHDQWMVHLSRAAGRNLGPFFQHWGVPTSEEARKAIANLPEWMANK